VFAPARLNLVQELLMRRILMLVGVIALFGLAIAGCRAEGEIDTRTGVVAPR
jgi:hypothetical protein